MRKDYARFVELSNKGAVALELRRYGRDVARQVRHARRRLRAELDRSGSSSGRCTCRCMRTCGAVCTTSTAPSCRERAHPAHLLGNLWQQDWSNIYDVVAPAGVKPVFSLTDNLKAKKIEPLEMVRIGERFFTSLGL